jgi:hypothetical protein
MRKGILESTLSAFDRSECAGIGGVVIAPPLVDRGQRECDHDGCETQAREEEGSGIGAGRDYVGALCHMVFAFRDRSANLNRGDKATRRPAYHITAEFLDFGLR